MKNSKKQQMIEFLYQGGSYTAKELSERFDIGLRSVQNYLKELQENSGLQKNRLYYSIPNELRNIEIQEHLQMSTALMIALYRQAVPTLQKSITENFKTMPKELDAFIFDTEFETIDNEVLFNQIVSAILNKYALHFDYTNKDGITSHKNIFALKVANLQGYWYLMGYDLEDEIIKTFYIKNITSLQKHEESYLDAQKITELLAIAKTIDSPWFNEHQQVVRLQFRDEAMHYIQRDKFHNIKIVEQGKETLLADMSYYNDIEVLRFVKQRLPHVSIVDNQQLQEKLVEDLKKAVEVMSHVE